MPPIRHSRAGGNPASFRLQNKIQSFQARTDSFRNYWKNVSNKSGPHYPMLQYLSTQFVLMILRESRPIGIVVSLTNVQMANGLNLRCKM